MADWTDASAELAFRSAPSASFRDSSSCGGRNSRSSRRRALEILAALVERPGELVSRDELTPGVWPNIIVAESNLKVHAAALRRSLAVNSREALIPAFSRG